MNYKLISVAIASFLAGSFYSCKARNFNRADAARVQNIQGMSKSGIRFVSWQDAQNVAELQELGHNDGHHIGLYDKSVLNLETLKSEVQAKDISANGCKARAYGKTLQDAQAIFADILKWEDSNENSRAWKNKFETMKQIVEDATNVGLFTSRFVANTEDDSESCAYFDIYVFRADGTAIKFTVNHTD